MTEYKLVPVEPTEEMMEAGHYAMVDGYHPGGVYRTMLDAASAVQVEPVAWALPDPDPTDGRPFLVLFHSTSQVNDPSALIPLYAAPKPAPDVSALVELLAEARDHVVSSTQPVRGGFIDEIDTALAAHRKQGGGS